MNWRGSKQYKGTTCTTLFGEMHRQLILYQKNCESLSVMVLPCDSMLFSRAGRRRALHVMHWLLIQDKTIQM